MKILVTGEKGQLGSELKKNSPTNNNFEWIFTDRQSFNISDLENINVFLDKSSPDIIINCAAYTAVDNAEDDFEPANTINHKSVELIAKWSNDNNCKLIHISTDYVYDGSSLIAVKEDTQANPVNNYGKTKLFGDLACLKNNPSSIIENYKSNKELLKVTDILGRESKGTKNQPLFYIYDDGTVEKRIVIE